MRKPKGTTPVIITELDAVIGAVRTARDAATLGHSLQVLLSLGHVNRLLDHICELRRLNLAYQGELRQCLIRAASRM